jgi:hypothetical protein
MAVWAVLLCAVVLAVAQRDVPRHQQKLFSKGKL